MAYSDPHCQMMNHALAYYAYALGDSAGCIAYLERIPDIGSLQSSIPSSRPDSLGATLQVPGGSYEPSTSSVHSSFASNLSILPPDIQDGRAWAMTEAMRSICLKGAHDFIRF